MSDSLQQTIDAAWEDRNAIGPDTKGEVRQAVDKAIASLDRGEARIAEKAGGEWIVNGLARAVSVVQRLAVTARAHNSHVIASRRAWIADGYYGFATGIGIY